MKWFSPGFWSNSSRQDAHKTANSPCSGIQWLQTIWLGHSHLGRCSNAKRDPVKCLQPAKSWRSSSWRKLSCSEEFSSNIFLPPSFLTFFVRDKQKQLCSSTQSFFYHSAATTFHEIHTDTAQRIDELYTLHTPAAFNQWKLGLCVSSDRLWLRLFFPCDKKCASVWKWKCVFGGEESKHMTAFLHEGKEGKDGRERASERTLERNWRIEDYLKKKVCVRRGGMWKRRIERKDDGKWDWAGKKGAPRVYGKYLEVQGQVKWTPAPMMHCNLTERAKLLIELHFWPEL